MSPKSSVATAQVPKIWIPLMVFGAIASALGVWLIFSTNAKIGTLAVLLALALFVAGIGELLWASERRHAWVGYALGGLFMVAALVTLLRPGKSLYFLAVFVGASMILTGVIELSLAIFERDEIDHWVLLAVIGLAGIVTGVLAIAWPDITIWVLGFVIGIRILFFGILEMAVANQLRKLTA
jgi:uncharacterized membrane protein HdeD (DUF308 family)